METIVGLSFFAVLFSGVAALLYASSRPKPSSNRQRWTSIGLAITGAAFLGMGALTFCFIRNSPRPEIEGWISGVRHSRSGSSVFTLSTPEGRTASIRASYIGPGLRDGDRARVRYVQYNHALLDLTMLSGSYTGWQLHESAGLASPLTLILIGIVSMFAANRESRKLLPEETLR
jgi:uncharacterized membrane protein